MGAFAAYNPISNKVAWYNNEHFSVWGGVLATASNLVFYGTLDRWFKAVDAQSGQELWKFQVGSGVIGNVFTYGHKGKQHIGVISGVGGLPRKRTIDTAPSYGPMTEPGAAGGFYLLTKSNSQPGAGAINIFSL